MTDSPSILVTLPADERRFLQEAADYLESPSFLMRIANLMGKPAEALLSALPNKAQQVVADSTNSALHGALDWAVRSLPRAGGEAASESRSSSSAKGRWHTALAATTGAVGGFFGLAGAAIEIPATTMVMLRSIACMAVENGADLADPAVRLQCLSVFSYGAPSLEKMESAYFTSRLGMALVVKDAAAFLAGHTSREVSEALTKNAAPALIRLMNQIGSRFQIVVSQKLAAQAVPIAGAATGALINAAFTDHFNSVAHFHFGIVRLERLRGKEAVQAAYHEARLSRLNKPASE